MKTAARGMSYVVTRYCYVLHIQLLFYQVRSEFDDILLKHAGSLGAKVFELTRVKSLGFSPDDPSKPISATWAHTWSNSDGSDAECSHVIGTTTFDYLVDASGRTGILSTGHLKNRHFNESLRNIAVWGYWKGVATPAAGTPREGAPWFEALTGKYSRITQELSKSDTILWTSGR